MAILTLAEAKIALDINVTDYDAELPDYIDAAQEIVDDLCGPSEPIAVTDVRRACGVIVLSTRPFLSLTSITGQVYGALTVGDYWVSEGGAIRAKRNGVPIYDDVWTVVYQAGRSSVPKAIKQGCRIILEHQWELQRGTGTRASRFTDESTVIPGRGYAVPNRALQTMGRYLRGALVA